MKITIKNGVCSVCHKNISMSLELLGESMTLIMHKATHEKDAYKDLLIKWRDKLDPVFIKELEEVFE